jgi:hypothetical protein
MPRKGSSGRGKGPVVPEVALETWKVLLREAEETLLLGPWEWMDDSMIVGLRHPVMNEILLVSILGQMREVFAVVLYRNIGGHRWLLETILDDGAKPYDHDAAMEQDAVKVEFALKSELEKEDRAVLKGAGFKPLAKSGCVWPQFRSFAPGGYPWFVTQMEAETLAWVLPRVLAVARLVLRKPDLWERHLDGEIAFLPVDYDPTQGELAADRIDWQPMIPPPERAPEEVRLAPDDVAKLLRLEKGKGLQLEVDIFYAPMAVAGVDRPRFPKAAMAVDRKSGYVGGMRLTESGDGDGAAALGMVLRRALGEFGVRPDAFVVQRPRVGAMLRKLSEELEIRIVEEKDLEMLNLARASLEEHFSGR